jgi:hypothetical protein
VQNRLWGDAQGAEMPIMFWWIMPMSIWSALVFPPLAADGDK